MLTKLILRTVTLKENDVAFVADFALYNTYLVVECALDSHYKDLELYINDIPRELTTEVMVTGDLTIVASCNPRKYTVSFDLQDKGDPEKAPDQVITYLEYAEEPISQYIPGEIIDGWYLEAACEHE